MNPIKMKINQKKRSKRNLKIEIIKKIKILRMIKYIKKKKLWKLLKKRGKKFRRKKDNYIENIKANEEILIITKENQEKPELEKDVVEIQDQIPKEEKENIMKYIIEYLEQDKKFYLNNCEEELNKSIKEEKKKLIYVEVDENLEEISNEKEYDNNSIFIYEVKNKKFPLDGKIENKSYMKGNYLKKIDISPQIIQI